MAYLNHLSEKFQNVAHVLLENKTYRIKIT